MLKLTFKLYTVIRLFNLMIFPAFNVRNCAQGLI
jgi:hypothetical protein